ncbi:MAG: hypothetical protein QME47_07490, partial [Candidatus Thermoplasmatota archaeon]|nr:hypothetical protein [Candidatus Thermoplasmatota archaeon]
MNELINFGSVLEKYTFLVIPNQIYLRVPKLGHYLEQTQAEARRNKNVMTYKPKLSLTPLANPHPISAKS